MGCRCRKKRGLGTGRHGAPGPGDPGTQGLGTASQGPGAGGRGQVART